MPLSRSPRTDRRRRAMRENLSVYSDGSDEARVSPSRLARNAELPELTKKERGVAYSHAVRGACQQRVVQFIPVRKISLAGAVAASTFLPLLLIVLHYLVFVTGTLDWSGHPMSALLNANSPRSLAAWMSSHLWLLCLAATVLTFRLRKHKLDDYDGDYRLWFWLVFTCVIGSIDSTTRLTELFGAALDRWSQVHVGWSGTAIVSATLATLIGLLGLRLCSELKTVPTSLVLWLVGLVCWAVSAALSQTMFQLDMSGAARAWLRAAFWLSGLTSIWLCSLYYLRATFMEAQKRFLSRAMASSQSIPWRERLREAMPKFPKFGRARHEDDVVEELSATKRKKRVRPAAEATEDESDQRSSDQRSGEQRNSEQRNSEQRNNSNDRRDTARPVAATGNGNPNGMSSDKRSERNTSEPSSNDSGEPAVRTKRGWGFGLGKLALRPPAASAPSNGPVDGEDAEVNREYGKKSGWFGRRPSATTDDETTTKSKPSASSKNRSDEVSDTNAGEKRSLRDRFRWKRTELTEEQAAERKAQQSAKQESRQAAKQKARDDKARKKTDNDEAANAEGTTKRGWLRLPKPKLPKMSLPKPKFPKLKLPSFRLTPPTDANGNTNSSGSTNNRNQVPNVDASRPLPGTNGQRSSSADQDQDDNYRGMSKAERKRMKRMQRDDEGDRRAA